MLSNIIRRAFLVAVFSAIAGAASLAWADHGHGGWNGGRGFGGDHGHVSFGHFGGNTGWGNHWGSGGIRFYSGYGNYGWPYSYYRNYYYRPFAYSYFGYPYLYGYYGYPGGYYGYGYPNYYYSYPSDNYVNGGEFSYSDTPPREYVVSRPVSDVARVEFRLPDPQATIWVQGKEITSSGTVRRFQSPQLDPTQQYTYTVKAQWRDNGKLFEQERQVKVQPNALAVVDFTQPPEAARDAGGPAQPDLPPPQPRPAN